MSLIQSWRGRAQVPATSIPPVVAGREDMADVLEQLCRHRETRVIAHIDDLIRIWSRHQRSNVEVSHMLDQFIDIRSMLVRPQVTS